MTPAPVHLRPGRPSDLEQILALDRATDLAPHWPASAYAAILNASDNSTDPARCLIVAELPSLMPASSPTLAGFAVGLLHPGPEAPATRTAVTHHAVPHIAELEDVVVATHRRRAGIGRALCEAVFNWSRLGGATEIILEVRAASAGPIALYLSLGFTATGLRPRYYSDPDDDAVTMSLPI